MPVILNTQCTKPNFLWWTDQIADKMFFAGDADGGKPICSGDAVGVIQAHAYNTHDRPQTPKFQNPTPLRSPTPGSIAGLRLPTLSCLNLTSRWSWSL